MPFTQVSGFKVYYQAPQGLSSCNERPLILLVHGAGGSSRHWQPLLSQLSQDIIPLALDLPGHGKTSGTVLDTVEATADFLADFLTVLGIKQPICYVGQSLGGLIGLQFTLTYPEKVARSILMTTAPKIQLHPDFMASILSGEWDLTILRQSFAEEIPEGSKNLVLNEFQHTRLKDNARDFMGLSRVDLQDAIARIQIPTLIITGDDDVIISPRKSRLLHKQIPHTSLVNIPGAGHYVQVEQPAKVAREIEGFLLGMALARNE